MRKARLVLAALLVMLCGCSRLELQRQTFTVELGQDVYANAALYLKNPERYPTDEMQVVAVSSGIVKKENRFTSQGLDYLVVGEYDFRIRAGSTELDFSISIKDTQAPTIESYEDTITVPAETVIDWSQYITATDLSGVSYTCLTDFNTTAGSSHDVTVRISDRFGNAVERDITVNVR